MFWQRFYYISNVTKYFYCKANNNICNIDIVFVLCYLLISHEKLRSYEESVNQVKNALKIIIK